MPKLEDTLEDVALSRLEKIYKDKLAYYQEKLRAISVLKGGDGGANSHSALSTTGKFSVPETYDTNFSQDQKVYFVLRAIKEGYAEDVARELAKIDKGISPERASMLATQKLSKLNKKGYINHTRSGRQFKYWV
jgi:hypothetical protein